LPGPLAAGLRVILGNRSARKRRLMGF
jgi:hypothetical protein